MTNRRGRPLTSQAIGVLLRNQLYAGIVDVTEYGVRGKRGDFEPLISKEVGLPRPSGSARPVSEATAPVMVRPLPHADINDAVAGALRVTIVIEDAA